MLDFFSLLSFFSHHLRTATISKDTNVLCRKERRFCSAATSVERAKDQRRNRWSTHVGTYFFSLTKRKEKKRFLIILLATNGFGSDSNGRDQLVDRWTKSIVSAERLSSGVLSPIRHDRSSSEQLYKNLLEQDQQRYEAQIGE